MASEPEGDGVPGTKKDASAGRSPHRLRRGLVLSAWILVATFGLVEGGLRLLTTREDGTEVLMGTRLLPRPPLLPAQREILERPAEAFRYYRPDPELGWTLREGGESPDGLYHANALGLRTGPERPVPDLDSEGERVLLVGDSYTHGDEVAYADSWGRQLEKGLGAGTKVWNGGVSGYGTDQALLRFRALGARVRPSIAVLGIYREDLLRNLTFFRAVKHPFTGFPFGKPRYVLEKGRLVLRHRPVTPREEVAATLASYGDSPLSRDDALWFPELHRDDWRDASRLFRLWRSRRVQARVHETREDLVRGDGEGVWLTAHLARRFEEEARHAGARPLVVLLPGGPELKGYGPAGKPPARHLIRALDALEVTHVDCGPALHEALGDAPLGSLYAREGDGHPNAAGCRVIAEVVARSLSRR